DKAAALMPGNELHPFRLWGNQSLLIITVIDYRVTDIGKYVEFSIAIACTHGRKPALPILNALLFKFYDVGQYVFDLPVSSEISVKGGKGIWGMPKHQANLDFVITDDHVSSQYDLDGRFAMRITIDRPKSTPIRPPVHIGAANFCQFRGMLMKSYIYFRGKMGFTFRKKGAAELIIGDHPRLAPLRSLHIRPDPLFTAWLPESNGVLDDYFESWFLSYADSVDTPPEGLESVADLGLGEDWLAPPDRRVVDSKKN
ncbi:MAG: acetoacetate decarboxylase family protein, partial [Woeseiaceae bacterium]